ncbi:MAG: hypothetical protein ACI81L_000885 [Verrucomicrobiales bacterium]|jgi:hypothetical protein
MNVAAILSTSADDAMSALFLGIEPRDELDASRRHAVEVRLAGVPCEVTRPVPALGSPPPDVPTGGNS